MFNNYVIDNTTLIERNFLLLTHVRLIVKFYIWPLFVVFGLTGNCLSILVLTRRRLIRTSTNNYLTILAAFDSCYLIFTLILNFGSHPTFSQSAFTHTLLFLLRPLADFSSNILIMKFFDMHFLCCSTLLCDEYIDLSNENIHRFYI
ncbi:unnamed protein product [Rotaria sp. Silwood1]|nr:unnamed protein product [Rotaria sp. Silwood1]CAF4575234.1 unnamed protein product [Rotaria sp. Silwood1]